MQVDVGGGIVPEHYDADVALHGELADAFGDTSTDDLFELRVFASSVEAHHLLEGVAACWVESDCLCELLTCAGDIALLFQMCRVLDAVSVVLGGEFDDLTEDAFGLCEHTKCAEKLGLASDQLDVFRSIASPISKNGERLFVAFCVHQQTVELLAALPIHGGCLDRFVRGTQAIVLGGYAPTFFVEVFFLPTSLFVRAYVE